MNAQEAPREPEALQKESKHDKFKLRFAKMLLFGTLLMVLSRTTHIRQKFVDGNFTAKNSFRFGCLTLVCLVGCATFLVIKTPRNGDLAENMIKYYPIAAYSMTASALILLLVTFGIFTDLIGALGIVYFIGFWGLVINFIMICPF